jgi:benzoate membrane transport protein
LTRDGQVSGQAVLAGVVAAVVGFTSSFAVVLTGLSAVGATPGEAGSGLLVMSVVMGLGCLAFSWRSRTPVTMAWSTPGAALLAGASLPEHGYAGAVGAFVLAGVLYLLTALIRPVATAVQRVPTQLANAMLAGILLQLCIEPFRAVVASPAAVLPVILTWLTLLRVARRWAVPGAFAAALVVVVVSGSLADVTTASLVPHLTWTTPALDATALIAIGLPLYLVTMTSQNIPGVAVLRSFGYPAPLRGALGYAGATTAATAPFGGFSINLAAISAALAAGPVAHRDPARRWVAAMATGTTYLVLGALAAAVATVAAAAPAGVIGAVAGVALLGTFAASATAALSDEAHREAAALTLVVAASGVTVLGIGAPFWSLVAGGLLMLVLRAGRRTGRRPGSP